MALSGLALGVGSLTVAFKRLVSTPKLWPYALLPSLTLFGLMTLVLVLAAPTLVHVAVAQSGVTTLDTWYGNAGELALTAILWITSALFAVWIAIVVTPPLCAPALERLVRAEEGVLGVPERAPLSFWFELWCGAKAQMVALVFTATAWLLLSVVSLLVPALVIVTLPLKVIALAIALAWSLLDYPLTLRGIGPKQRMRLFAAQPATVLGFGVPLAVLFWFPCTSVLLLPVGAIAATRVVWQLAERDPTWHRVLTAAAMPSQPPR